MPVMPDTRIPLSGIDDGGQRPSSPFQTLGAMMQIKEQQQVYQARQREAERMQQEADDENATRAALAESPRPEDAVTRLVQEGRHGAAAGLAKNVYGERTARLQAEDARFKNHQTRLEQGAQILQGVTDEASYQTARKAVLELVQPIYGQSVNDWLPTNYDAGKIKQLIAAGTGRAQAIQQQQNDNQTRLRGYELGLMTADEAMSAFGPDAKRSPDVGKWSARALEQQEAQREVMARRLLGANSKQEWDDILGDEWENGTSQLVIQGFGGWDADAKKRAERLSMTSKDRAQALVSRANAANATSRVGIAEDAEERRRLVAEAAARKAAGGGSAGPQSRVLTTAPSRNAEDDSIRKENTETEKWLLEQWRGSPMAGAALGKTGYENLQKTYDDPTVEAKIAPIRKEYVARRVEAHNKQRERLQGLPPIEQAAQAAKANRDRTGYLKLQDEFKAITNGVAKLSDFVPWDDINAGVHTPEIDTARQQELDEVLKKLENTNLPADQKAALRRRMDELSNATR